MKFVTKNFYKIAWVAYSFIMPVVSFAQTGGSSPTPTGGDSPCVPGSGKICNPIPGVTSINGLIQKLLEGALKIGLPVVALAIIYCGFLFVQARGKPEALTKAKDALLYTLIGAAILLGSWAIATLISDTVLELGK